MDLRAPSFAPLPAPVPQQYLRKAQDRFDAASARVVEAAAGSEDPAPTDEAGSDLVSSVVGMKEESVVNQMLFGVFKAQARQQEEVAALLDHR